MAASVDSLPPRATKFSQLHDLRSGGRTHTWSKGANYTDADTSSDVTISALALGGESRFGVLAFTMGAPSATTTMQSAALYDAKADSWLPIAPEPAFLCRGGWPQHGVATERAVIVNTKAYYDVAAQRWAQPADFNATDPNIAMRLFEGQPAMCLGTTFCYKWTPPDPPPPRGAPLHRGGPSFTRSVIRRGRTRAPSCGGLRRVEQLTPHGSSCVSRSS